MSPHSLHRVPPATPQRSILREDMSSRWKHASRATLPTLDRGRPPQPAHHPSDWWAHLITRPANQRLAEGPKPPPLVFPRCNSTGLESPSEPRSLTRYPHHLEAGPADCWAPQGSKSNFAFLRSSPERDLESHCMKVKTSTPKSANMRGK